MATGQTRVAAAETLMEKENVVFWKVGKEGGNFRCKFKKKKGGPAAVSHSHHGQGVHDALRRVAARPRAGVHPSVAEAHGRLQREQRQCGWHRG